MNNIINELNKKLEHNDMIIKDLTEKNIELEEKYLRAIRILEKTELLPCEMFEEEFDCTKCEYCNTYCSNGDDKCWKHFIERGDSNE